MWDVIVFLMIAFLFTSTIYYFSGFAVKIIYNLHYTKMGFQVSSSGDSFISHLLCWALPLLHLYEYLCCVLAYATRLISHFDVLASL